MTLVDLQTKARRLIVFAPLLLAACASTPAPEPEREPKPDSDSDSPEYVAHVRRQFCIQKIVKERERPLLAALNPPGEVNERRAQVLALLEEEGYAIADADAWPIRAHRISKTGFDYYAVSFDEMPFVALTCSKRKPSTETVINFEDRGTNAPHRTNKLKHLWLARYHAKALADLQQEARLIDEKEIETCIEERKNRRRRDHWAPGESEAYEEEALELDKEVVDSCPPPPSTTVD